MLQKQSLNISLSQGINNKTDPKQNEPGQLAVLQNGIFTTPKEIRKRNGYTNLTTGFWDRYGGLSAASFISTLNNELFMGDGMSLFSYSPSVSAWNFKGILPVVGLTATSAVSNAYNQTNADTAIGSGGLQAVAYESSAASGALYGVGVDSATGALLLPETTISATGITPTCIANGAEVVVFFFDTNANALKYSTLSSSSNSFSLPTSIATDINTSSPIFDCFNYNGLIYVAYNTTSSTIKLLQLNSSLAIQATATVASTAAITLSVFGTTWNSADYAVVAYANSANVAYSAFLTSNLSTFASAINIASGSSSIARITGVGTNNASGQAHIFYDIVGATDSDGRYSNNSVSWITGAISTGSWNAAKTFCLSASLASRAVLNAVPSLYSADQTFPGGAPFVILNHDANLQPSYFLTVVNYAEQSTNPVCATLMPIFESSAGQQSATYPKVANLAQLANGKYQAALLTIDLLYTSATTPTVTQNGISLATLDFTKTNPSVQTFSNYALIGSSGLQMFDGTNVVEHGFFLYPEAITTTTATTGGNLGNGKYGYQIVYEWTDAQGNVHQSSPSVPFTVDLSSSGTTTNTITLTIPSLRITNKTGVRVVVYRTVKNQNLYYRVNLPSSPLISSGNSVTFTDTAADTTIQAQQQLYTTGGQVENIVTPAVGSLAVYMNRAMLFPSDNTGEFWYSEQVLPNTPVQFSDLFTINVGKLGGPLTGGIQLDDKFILFTASSIAFMYGEGPTPSGAGNTFSTPLLIDTSVGAVNAQSLVRMPMGIIFKSAKGIFLLDRSLTVQYIGAAVENYNSSTVLASTLVENANQVRFHLSDGTTLVYDYYVNQWSTFTNYSGISSTVWNGAYTFLQNSGIVSQEASGVFTDNGSAISLSLTTSWLNLGGIQGYQRIYKFMILGSYIGPHTLNASIAYDFDGTAAQTDAIPITTNPGNYEYRIFCARQKCTSIQLTLSDSQTSNFNEGLSLSAIGIELGIKQGLNKLPAANSVG